MPLRLSQLTDEKSQRPYEKDQDENHQPDGDVLERAQRLPMEHNAVRNLSGHNRSQRETHEPERPHRIANEHQPAGVVWMAWDQAQTETRHQPQEARPKEHAPQPAEEKKDEQRYAYQSVPPPG